MDKITKSMESAHQVSVLAFLVMLVPLIGGATCPEMCVCNKEQNARTVLCVGKPGILNVIKLKELLGAISNDTVKMHLMGITASSVSLKLFEKFSHLQELSIVHSHIGQLEHKTFSGLSNLEALYLSGNGIQSLPRGLFGKLTKLVQVDLSMNRISRLVHGTFLGAEKLEILNLQGTKLLHVEPGAFAGLTELKHLDLSDNPRLELFPRMFEDLNHLKFLGIRTMGLHSKLPHDLLRGLHSLTKLDLSFNKLDKIPVELQQVATSLQILILTQNNIHMLKNSAFNGFRNLKEIHLDFCNITHIQEHAFSGLQNLKLLKLDHNNLKSISPITLGSISRASVSFIGNLWVCDCGLYRTKLWLQGTGKKLDIICHEPYKHWRKRLQDLSPGDPNCSVPTIHDCCHESKLIKYGESATLNCSSNGFPKPVVKFSNISGPAILHYSGEILVIKSVTSDTNFSCEAKSAAGKSLKYFTIRVILDTCPIDGTVVAVFTILIVISLLVLFVLLYVKFRKRKKHLTKIDKKDNIIVKLLDYDAKSEL